MQITRCSKTDFLQIHSHITEFWGSDRALGVHHPMFIHEFGNTAYVIKNESEVMAYLFGFLSQNEPVAYVHLVGVRASYQRQGLARRLYQHFIEYARMHDCVRLKAITTHANAVSIAFHQSLGMKLLGEPNRDGIPVVADYAGVGQDRVVFDMDLENR